MSRPGLLLTDEELGKIGDFKAERQAIQDYRDNLEDFRELEEVGEFGIKILTAQGCLKAMKDILDEKGIELNQKRSKLLQPGAENWKEYYNNKMEVWKWIDQLSADAITYNEQQQERAKKASSQSRARSSNQNHQVPKQSYIVGSPPKNGIVHKNKTEEGRRNKIKSKYQSKLEKKTDVGILGTPPTKASLLVETYEVPNFIFENTPPSGSSPTNSLKSDSSIISETGSNGSNVNDSDTPSRRSSGSSDGYNSDKNSTNSTNSQPSVSSTPSNLTNTEMSISPVVSSSLIPTGRSHPSTLVNGFPKQQPTVVPSSQLPPSQPLSSVSSTPVRVTLTPLPIPTSNTPEAELDDTYYRDVFAEIVHILYHLKLAIQNLGSNNLTSEAYHNYWQSFSAAQITLIDGDYRKSISDIYNFIGKNLQFIQKSFKNIPVQLQLDGEELQVVDLINVTFESIRQLTTIEVIQSGSVPDTMMDKIIFHLRKLSAFGNSYSDFNNIATRIFGKVAKVNEFLQSEWKQIFTPQATLEQIYNALHNKRIRCEPFVTKAQYPQIVPNQANTKQVEFISKFSAIIQQKNTLDNEIKQETKMRMCTSLKNSFWRFAYNHTECERKGLKSEGLGIIIDGISGIMVAASTGDEKAIRGKYNEIYKYIYAHPDLLKGGILHSRTEKVIDDFFMTYDEKAYSALKLSRTTGLDIHTQEKLNERFWSAVPGGSH